MVRFIIVRNRECSNRSHAVSLALQAMQAIKDGTPVVIDLSCSLVITAEFLCFLFIMLYENHHATLVDELVEFTGIDEVMIEITKVYIKEVMERREKK